MPTAAPRARRRERERPAPKTIATPWSPRTATIAIASLTVLQLWALGSYFPASSWTTGEPFYTNSYGLHFARALSGASSMAAHLRLWSYSPSLMAGYPAGTRTEPMGDLVALWLLVCNGLAAPRSIAGAAVMYKLMVVAIFGLAPAAMAAAALWLGADASVAVIAAAMGAFGTFNYPGLMMIRAGMFGFFGASFLSVTWSAFLYDSLDKRPRRMMAVAIGAALLTYLHPLAPILMIPASVGALAETRSARRIAALAAAFAIAAVLSLGCLGPLLLTRNIGVPFANWWMTPRSIGGGLKALIRWRLPFPAVAVAAIAIYGAHRSRVRRRFLFAWMGGMTIAGILAFFGSVSESIGYVEPGRFEAAFYFMAAPFGAIGARELWSAIRALPKAARRIAQVLAAGTVALFAFVSGASLWVETTAHGPVVASLPELASELKGWVEMAGRDARLVMESGWTVDENGGVASPYFGSDIGLLWALELDRELIGASPSEGFTTFSFADFGNQRAFGRPLDSWPPAEFRTQLEIYNIGSIILWSAEAKRFISQVEGVVELQQAGPYTLYGVAGDHSFLRQGKAAGVSASADCIRIKRAEAGRLILKYHYFRTLSADPPIPIGPEPVGNGDPNPFIAIDNDAPRDIRIYNAGFAGWGRASKACD